MAELTIRGLAKDHGSVRVLHPLDLDVERGAFVTVLGPSGCGKSTLMRLLMGILPATAGRIALAGQAIESLPPERRDIAMVFQSYALFPHMSVRQNLAFGLRMKKVPRPERERRIAHALEICDLGDYVARMPRQLSGGQQQRVALARAIVMRPKLLLFDEPLSNLDAKLRDGLRQEIVDLHRRTGATSLYVTHDQTEAMTMSDRIVVMNEGRIVETGTPADLYRTPTSLFTATFLGQTNLIEVVADAGKAGLPWGGDCRLDRPAAGRVTVSARPETITLAPHAGGAGEIRAVAFMGASALYTLDIGGRPLKASRSGTDAILSPGQRVDIGFLVPPHVLSQSAQPVDAS